MTSAADSAGIWATSSQISRMMAPAGPLEYNRSWYNPCSYGIRTELEATSRINRLPQRPQ